MHISEKFGKAASNDALAFAATNWSIFFITKDLTFPNSRVGLSEGLNCAATRGRFSKRLPEPEVSMETVAGDSSR